MEQEISNRLAILGHPQRLALFRLLVRRYPDRVPATELAQALALRPNTLSTYVSALMHAGLVTRERVGTSLRYAVHVEAVRDTFDYLLHDCCRGRPDLCAPLAQHNLSGRKYNVLFVCTGNSARSIFAEALLRDTAGERFAAFSAGTDPRTDLNPLTRHVLHHNGHDLAELSSKDLSTFQAEDAPKFDFVFTVCDQAANADGPAWRDHPVCAHWGMPDPAKADGSEAEKTLAFLRIYDALRDRIKAFCALPITSLDRLALQQAVDHIALTNTGPTA